MVKRLVLLVLAAAVIGLLIGSVALAATPHTINDIITDFHDNGKLDDTYTRDELLNFLNNSHKEEYPPDDIDEINQAVTDELNQRPTFPFTGFQLMIAGIVAVALVGGGLVLRRFARSS
jgi:hypothetical protein